MMTYAEELKAERRRRRKAQHDEHDRVRHEESRFHHEFTIEQVRHLAKLAQLGITPDGTYSDDECALWEFLLNYTRYGVDIDW